MKEVAKKILSKEPMLAAEIWKRATSEWGYWSRQSLYTILKDKKVFCRQGEKFALANGTKFPAVHDVNVDDKEAENFINQVQSNQVVSNVQ